MKKALIFSPYLDSFGGGEVYALNFATCFKKNGYQVELAWKDKDIISPYKDRFNLDLSEFVFNSSLYDLFTHKSSPWATYQKTKKYDSIFFLSDGSIPFLFGKKNFLHFQVPFTNLDKSFLARLKLLNQTVICNSKFTKHTIDRQLGISSQVLYPPVEMRNEAPKEKIILGVGRFTSAMHNKRQDVLVEAFKKLSNKGLKNWKLLLIGSDKEGGEMVKQIRDKTQGLAVEIITNADYKTLDKAYARAQIYWHASGYEVDEKEHPEAVEHFGISTVEAMSAGCIPIVINKGGQKEIVDEGSNGYLFETVDELVSKTTTLISLTKEKQNTLRANARETAAVFSRETFCKKLDKLL